MTTPLTAGRVYLFDYSSDSGTDADTYELDGYTAGEDYCYMYLDRIINDPHDQKGDISYYWGGEGYFLREEEIHEPFVVAGYVISRTELKNFKEWYRRSFDNSSDPDYLCIKYGTNDYYPFYDEDKAPWEYARGWCKRLPSIKQNSSDESTFYRITVEFHVVWD